MNDNNLLKTYDNIGGAPKQRSLFNTLMPLSSNPKLHSYRQGITADVANFKEKCAKHILLDIYMKVLPFDDDYCRNNRGLIVNDLDKYLATKNTSGLQYLKSSQESTKAPLLEFIVRSINNIGTEYYESATDELKRNSDEGIDVPPEPIPDDENSIDNQLVDIKKDSEYEDFIDKLKKKTINKIVNDISDLLKDKKDENNMAFNVQMESGNSQSKKKLDDAVNAANRNWVQTNNNKDLIQLYNTTFPYKKIEVDRVVTPEEKAAALKELNRVANYASAENIRQSMKRHKYQSSLKESSTFTIAMEYITEWCIKNKNDANSSDDAIGLAIRESVLNDFDIIFKQRPVSLNEYATRLRFGKGIVINESSLGEVVENFI